jgi:hypothetical protein
MTLTTFSFEESCQSALGDLDLAAWRTLGLLLESVEQDDAPPTNEAVDDPVDIRLALFS